MPFLLRLIKRHRWYIEPAQPFLDAGNFPADPLADLNTENNILSVWQIDNGQSNLDRVVTALAANRQFADKVDYALVEQSAVDDLGIQIERAFGQTPDNHANGWHRDLRQLSATNLVGLAKAILDENKRGRISAKEIKRLLRDAVESGHVSFDELQPKLQQSL